MRSKSSRVVARID